MTYVLFRRCFVPCHGKCSTGYDRKFCCDLQLWNLKGEVRITGFDPIRKWERVVSCGWYHDNIFSKDKDFALKVWNEKNSKLVNIYEHDFLDVLQYLYWFCFEYSNFLITLVYYHSGFKLKIFEIWLKAFKPTHTHTHTILF